MSKDTILTEWRINESTAVERPLDELRERRIKQRAREDAKMKLPEADSKSPEGIEATIWDNTVQQCKNLIAGFSGILESAQNEVRSKLSVQPFNESYEISDGQYPLRGSAESIRRDNAEGINAVEKTRFDTESVLRHFRSLHSLRREAFLPKNVFLILGIFLACILIETIANGIIFRDVQDGLDAGLLLAGGLSLANVAMGFGLGFICLRTFHRKAEPEHQVILGVKKAAAGIGAVALIGLGLFLNFYIAHFREIASAFEGDGVPYLAPMEVLSDPFALNEPMAFLLLLIGLGIFFYAAYKGYSSVSDPVPDYTKTTLKQMDALDSRNDLIGDLRADIRDTYAAKRDELESRKAMEARKAKAAQEVLSKVVSEQTAIRNGIDSTIAEGNRFLSVYRTENKHMRIGVNIPRFSNFVEISSVVGSKDLLKSTEDLENMVADIDEQRRSNAVLIDDALETLVEAEGLAIEEFDDFIETNSLKVASGIGFGNDVRTSANVDIETVSEVAVA